VADRLRARGPRAALRLPRRGLLVALSGIDGAGKSSQARWLADSLTALGADVDIVWNDLLGSRVLDVLAAGPKALLRLGGRSSEGMARWEDPAPGGEDAIGGALRGAWSMVVTLTDALEQRVLASRSLSRGRVVVFDRSPLDLAVRMQVLYRASVERQRRLVRLAAPRPNLAYLLDIPSEVSLARKRDVWSRAQLTEQRTLYRTLASEFGARRLDGRRPPQDIAAEIAREAWLALR
jgi:dTMP kinase